MRRRLRVRPAEHQQRVHQPRRIRRRRALRLGRVAVHRLSIRVHPVQVRVHDLGQPREPHRVVGAGRRAQRVHQQRHLHRDQLAVLPALGPLAAAQPRAEAGDDLALEHAVHLLEPGLGLVRLAVGGDAGHGQRREVAPEVVRVRAVSQVALLHVPVEPRVEPLDDERAQLLHARLVVQPVEGERRVHAEGADRVAGVAAHDVVAALAVADPLLVLDQRAHVLDRAVAVALVAGGVPAGRQRADRVAPLQPEVAGAVVLLVAVELAALLHLAPHGRARLDRGPHARDRLGGEEDARVLCRRRRPLRHRGRQIDRRRRHRIVDLLLVVARPSPGDAARRRRGRQQGDRQRPSRGSQPAGSRKAGTAASSSTSCSAARVRSGLQPHPPDRDDLDPGRAERPRRALELVLDEEARLPVHPPVASGC